MSGLGIVVCPYTATKNTAVRNLNFFIPLAFFGLFLTIGCDQAQPKNRGQGVKPVVQDAPPLVEVPLAAPEQKEPAKEEDNAVMVQAAPGMSGRGNFGPPTGNNPMEIITVPISTLFHTRDRLALMQIEQAMNLYRAEHGQFPATHAEFWERIVVANMLHPTSGSRNKLPELPPGQEYVYDPRDGVLKVRKPRDAP